MKRFLMLVGVAVVAAAMYVAASPASQQAGPTAKQFAALKKQVAALSKKVKSTQTDVDTLAFAYVHCSLAVGDRRGPVHCAEPGCTRRHSISRA